MPYNQNPNSKVTQKLILKKDKLMSAPIMTKRNPILFLKIKNKTTKYTQNFLISGTYTSPNPHT